MERQGSLMRVLQKWRDAIRFSSHLNPVAFFIHKRQLEARDRGEFIDIHDIGGPDPRDYDVLIKDSWTYLLAVFHA